MELRFKLEGIARAVKREVTFSPGDQDVTSGAGTFVQGPER